LQLATEGVALDFDVEYPDQWLIEAADVAGQQDRSGAGPVERSAGLSPGPDGLEQVVLHEQFPDRSALAARQDQPVKAVQVARQAHLASLRPERPQGLDVLDEGPLQRQHADREAGIVVQASYQPRTAISS